MFIYKGTNFGIIYSYTIAADVPPPRLFPVEFSAAAMSVKKPLATTYQIKLLNSERMDNYVAWKSFSS